MRGQWTGMTKCAALVWGMAVAACSGGGNSATPSPLCISAPYGGQCTGCLQSLCSSQLSTFSGACGVYLACACPGGTFNDVASQANSCQAQLAGNTCSDADMAFAGCLISRCSNECSTVADGGARGGGGTGETAFSCYLAVDMTCNEYQLVPSAVASMTQMCVQSGGAGGTLCPTAALQGCCKTGSTAVCYYAAASASAGQMACVQDGGIWSASP